MNHKQIFSDNLKRFMKENGKSRREVSASLGISYYTFSDWVNAKKMPRMDKVEQLAEYFGYSTLFDEKHHLLRGILPMEIFLH